MLVLLKFSRNISVARLLIQNGQVIVNGVMNYNYNYCISKNDIVQVRSSVINNSSLNNLRGFVVNNIYKLRYLT